MSHSRILLLLLSAGLLLPVGRAEACPFCTAVSQTFRQELEVMDAVVIATSVGGNEARDRETGQLQMKIERVLKGEELVKVGQKVTVVYYGDVSAGRRFLLTGADPTDIQWSCLPVSEKAEAYMIEVTKLSDDPVERLKFYYQHLNDTESMLARDTYDEFAIAPYDAIKKLAPHIDRDRLVDWLSEPELSTDRKRLYLTMLGVCGDKSDLPRLEEMLRASKKSKRGGLDALIACYLTLAGESGLELVNELFLNNQDAAYAEAYAAIMAIRFHGTEGNVIPRSALLESLHFVLNRQDIADLVIPDLARWGDWSQIDRLTQLFTDAEADNNWVRVPVVNYLRACPLPEAKAALIKLEEIDPESVRRANTFFSIPIPARDTDSSSSSLPVESDQKFAAGGSSFRQPGQPTAAVAVAAPTSPLGTVNQASNPWRLAYVLSLAAASIMIFQYLLLAGGKQPART